MGAGVIKPLLAALLQLLPLIDLLELLVMELGFLSWHVWAAFGDQLWFSLVLLFELHLRQRRSIDGLNLLEFWRWLLVQRLVVLVLLFLLQRLLWLLALHLLLVLLPLFLSPSMLHVLLHRYAWLYEPLWWWWSPSCWLCSLSLDQHARRIGSAR